MVRVVLACACTKKESLTMFVPSKPNEHEATELLIYLRTSSAPLYRQQLEVEQEIAAQKLGEPAILTKYRRLVAEAAREYSREYASRDRFGMLFSGPTREAVAEILTRDYLSGVRR